MSFFLILSFDFIIPCLDVCSELYSILSKLFLFISRPSHPEDGRHRLQATIAALEPCKPLLVAKNTPSNVSVFFPKPKPSPTVPDPARC